jgi:hypothetical protein
MLYLKGLILASLIGIIWQDYKFRAVYWWFFLLLLIALGALKSIVVGLEAMTVDFGYNLIFLSVQFLLLSVYFCIKEKKIVNIFNGFFGLGDLFFLIGIAAYFSPLNYLAFYMISLFFVVVLNLAKGLFSTRTLKIPLAGEQSILLIVMLLVTQFNIITDTWLIHHFIN